jgi:hypothetical protein
VKARTVVTITVKVNGSSIQTSFAVTL